MSQVALEGSISKNSARSALAQGQQPTGDLIPWNVSQQFQESSFASLSGARVVRVAVHPELQRGGTLLQSLSQGCGTLQMLRGDSEGYCLRVGYGTRAIDLIRRYYGGEICELDENEQVGSQYLLQYWLFSSLGTVQLQEAARQAAREEAAAIVKSNNSSADALLPRKGLPPLLTNLSDRPPEKLHYLGVSYGLTQVLNLLLPLANASYVAKRVSCQFCPLQELFNFWSRAGYFPVYLRQTASETTGEHTCIMIRPLAGSDELDTNSADLTEQEQRLAHENSAEWLRPFVADFRKRLVILLGRSFNHLPTALCLALINPRLSQSNSGNSTDSAATNTTKGLFSLYDLKRLDSYCRNLADYHLIMDLVPKISQEFFEGAFYPLSLSYVQAAILLALGKLQVFLSGVSMDIT